MSSPALAETESDLRQKLFETDKVAALADFNPVQKQACLKALDTRYQSHYRLSGALAFDERLSMAAYDRLFWKGDGNLQRGLIFTGAVEDQSGAKAGNVLCYYATTDYRLDFQSAYVLPLRAKNADMASNAPEYLQAALISPANKR